MSKMPVAKIFRQDFLSKNSDLITVTLATIDTICKFSNWINSHQELEQSLNYTKANDAKSLVELLRAGR